MNSATFLSTILHYYLNLSLCQGNPFLEMASLSMGSSEQIPCFALLAHAAFALPFELSLSQAMTVLIFTLLVLLPIPLEGA